MEKTFEQTCRELRKAVKADEFIIKIMNIITKILVCLNRIITEITKVHRK